MEDEKSNVFQINNNNLNRHISLTNNKKEYLNESNVSSHSESHLKKNESDNNIREAINSKDNIESNIYNLKSEKTEGAYKLDTIAEETNNHIEEMKKGSYNIMVAVRCRPLSHKEKDFSEFEIVKILDKKIVILIDPYEYNGHSEIFKNRSREQQYAFDYAFDKTTSQLTLFNNTVKFLLDGVVNGYNATVFAYGATGAGKTYTMLGTEDQEGIMVLTLREMFDKISFYSSERDYKVKLWYIEIYNENIRDLLSNTDEYLDLREDPIKGISISNINELNVTSCKDIMQLLKKGNKNRTQEATNANETSSRSHAILQVQVEYKDKVTGMDAEIKVGKLSMIDLAGSERASATQNRGIRLIEGANINRSLLTLGNCINALCEANEKGTKPYVPYRDSKLTRLLKDSLGGNSRTVMITNVSPSVTTFDDTYNTLKYANRAKNIKTQVHRNVLNVQYHISNYNQIINNLKSEITELKSQLAKRDPSYSQLYNITSNADKYLNNNICKVESKKEDSKEPRNSNLIIIFEKSVNELKNHLHEEFSLKNKILDQEQEIMSLTNFILTNNKNIEDQNGNNVNLKDFHNSKNNSTRNLLNIQSNLENIQNDEIIRINTEPCKDEFEKDKENFILQQNNSVMGGQYSMIHNNTEIDDYSSTLVDKENKLVKLKKSLERNVSRLSEMFKKKEIMLNIYSKNGIKDFYFDYLKSMVKSNNLKMFIMENKLKEKYNHNVIEVKEEYISNLENQLKYREDLIKIKNINLTNDENEKMKSLDQIKKEYINKLPPILPKGKNINSFNTSCILNKNELFDFEKLGLPPISGYSANNANVTNTNLTSILSDIKNINNNIIKIENDYKRKEKSKMKNQENQINQMNQNQNINKLNHARNYSQGVRNLNIGAPTNNLNLINQQNNNQGNFSNKINQKLLEIENFSAKNLKKLKPCLTANVNLTNNNSKFLNREFQSEKSFSNQKNSSNQNNYININQNTNTSDNEVYMLDFDNSTDEYEGNIKRLKNLNKERKQSSQPTNITGNHINIKDDTQFSSPTKRDLVKMNSNKRDESLSRIDVIPQIRKRDLNVFLNEKSKSKQRKAPFK